MGRQVSREEKNGQREGPERAEYDHVVLDEVGWEGFQFGGPIQAVVVWEGFR